MRSIVRKCLMITAVLVVFLCSCSTKKENEPAGYTELSQLKEKRIGVTTGSIQSILVEKMFPDAEILHYSTTVDMLEALKTGKVDAFAEAEALLKIMLGEYPEVTYLDEKLGSPMQVGAIFPKNDKGRKYCDEYSEYLRRIKNDGTYDGILQIWYGDDEDLRVIEDPASLPGPNGTLHMAVFTSAVPFAYVKDGKVVGIDIDLAAHFCREYGYRLELVQMDFPAVLPAVLTGKCEFAGGGIAYTAERAETFYYSEFTMESNSVMAVLKGTGASGYENMAPSIMDSFEKTFIRENRWKLFAEGAWNTVLITILSVIFGTLLGFGAYLLVRSGNRIGVWFVNAMTWLIAGMPAIVLLMVLYYIIFSSSGIRGTTVAVIAFSLIFGTSMYGMICSGVDAVDKGQTEAAYALGYKDKDAFFRIILPQAAIHFLPSYKSQITALLKATAVVGYVTVLDLTKMGDIVRSRTYEPFFPLIAVTVIYFILSGLLTKITDILTRRVNPKKRTQEEILKGVQTHD